MLTLAAPYFLLLLPLVPLLVWRWLRRPRAALRHPDLGQLRDAPVGRAWVAVFTGAALRAAALTAIVLALTGPRWPDLRTRIETEGVAILMLLDVSGSMSERDFTWNDAVVSRLEAAKRAFRLFVAGGEAPDGQRFRGRPTDLVGLVAFAGHPDTACPLTLSHSALLKILDTQRPRNAGEDPETNISDGLVLALDRLRAAGERKKYVVLLSDGEHNFEKPESGWTPRQAARVAEGLKVPVYAIDAGKETGVGTSTLVEVARISGGRAFSARDGASLLDACRAIDGAARDPVTSYQYRRYHEAYPGLALTALLCWSVALALEWTAWRRLP